MEKTCKVDSVQSNSAAPEGGWGLLITSIAQQDVACAVDVPAYASVAMLASEHYAPQLRVLPAARGACLGRVGLVDDKRATPHRGGSADVHAGAQQDHREVRRALFCKTTL